MAWHYPDPQGAVAPLSQGGEWGSLNPLLKQGFAPLCPYHGITSRSLQDKHWLFILFLLLLPFRRANRRLIVNSSTGAHLLLVSGNAKS